MQSYSTNMEGSLKIEKVDKLPNWTSYDTGRFLYDLSTKKFYLGTSSIEYGNKGWIVVGLSDKCIKSYHIDWDIDLTNKAGCISAKDIPVLYENKPNNIQNIISLAEIYFKSIKNGTFLGNGCIKDYHLDVNSIHSINADSIPYTNDKYFSITTPLNKNFFSIEDAIIHVYTREANEINLENTDRENKFGDLLSFDAKTVQDALEQIELYLSTLTASQVSVVYPGCECKTNVQAAIDALYKIAAQGAFTDLADTPIGYNNGKYVKSTEKGLTFTQINSSDVLVNYSGLDSNSTLDDYIELIQSDLTKLDNKINNLSANNIKFDYTSDNLNFTNTQQCLLYLIKNYFSSNNLPSANQISCIPIGSEQNNTVQLALSYLANTVSTISNSFNCSTSTLSINNAEHTLQETLDYIINFINYMIDEQNISYSKF